MVAEYGENTATNATPHMTSPGSTVGTVAYMSPEQVRADELDPRTDLFSFGAVLYETATGVVAFQGSSSGVTFEAILNRTPQPVSEVNPSIPAKLEELISKSLEKDRDMRYQTAAELRGDLKRIKRDLDSSRVRASNSASVASASAVSTPAIQQEEMKKGTSSVAKVAGGSSTARTFGRPRRGGIAVSQAGSGDTPHISSADV